MDAPTLEQFRIEPARDGLIHLVFDMPDRSMNVFSNAAIHEIGVFAAWLKTSDVRGVVVRSGKTTAFCAGADLGELGVAYDMIVTAPQADRFQIAFDHFFPLSQGFRALETSGKPVAAAIGGLALGGGCELAMATHYRVLADTPKAALGLPESLVGLLPGAGGTQRLPRLVGVEAALPILLDGARLSGQAAVDAGLAHQLVPSGEEVAAAEAWLLSDAATAVQSWDRPGGARRATDAEAILAAERARVLARTLGHEPAPLAILDCIEQGLPLDFDAAIRAEMTIFSRLIQRREPRDMIQTLFVGKLDHDRALKAGGLPEDVGRAVLALRTSLATARAVEPGALAAAGFSSGADIQPVQTAVADGYWLDGDASDSRRARARVALAPVVATAVGVRASLDEAAQRIVDYALVSAGEFPAYLGGPLRFASSR